MRTPLNIHPDTVRRAIEVERFQHAEPLRPSLVDPYLPFVREMLEQYPRLRSTRLYQMIRDRGYSGSVEQLRRTVARLRPQPQEAFLRWQVFPAEQAQVDWAYFGSVTVGRAKRQLSCFVMTLSWSRALYLEFFFDQTTENFLRGHVRAFQDWSGAPRVILYDNLKSAVLERRGNRIHFNPRLLELAADYHFAPRPCQVRAGNQKGRVERAIRYVRDSFWAGRAFTTLAECNRQALAWRDEVAHQRRWPDDSARTVAQAFAEEQPRLLPLPLHPFNTDRIEPVRSRKTLYVHFDLNDYSIPPEARNLILAGANGLGKTMIAQNICHAAVLQGHSVLFRSAAALLEELHRQTPEGRQRKLRTYANVGLLCVDEVGYLSFDDKSADLLYEVINRRYERKSVVLTTNRPFKEWNEVFPNAACIVTLLDRLLHHADVTAIEGESYRKRESEQETTARRRRKK